MFRFSIERYAAWAPGIEGDNWDAWARGEIQIDRAKDVPGLKFMPPLSRRRLSQLSKMILHVGNELIEDGEQIPVVYHSNYGEVTRQYSITQEIIEQNEVSPSAFSQSVFNTPVALLSIFKKNRQLNNAVFGCPVAAITEAISKIDKRPESMAVILFGDELLPEEYNELVRQPPLPFAFGLRVSGSVVPGSVTMQIHQKRFKEETHPLELLSWVLMPESRDFLFCTEGTGLLFSREG